MKKLLSLILLVSSTLVFAHPWQNKNVGEIVNINEQASALLKDYDGILYRITKEPGLPGRYRIHLKYPYVANFETASAKVGSKYKNIPGLSNNVVKTATHVYEFSKVDLTNNLFNLDKISQINNGNSGSSSGAAANSGVQSKPRGSGIGLQKFNGPSGLQDKAIPSLRRR